MRRRGNISRIWKRIRIGWRSGVLLGVFVILYAGLLNHVYTIQIEQQAMYSARAESQYRSLGVLGARRGNIFFQDKNGTRMHAAVTRPTPALYAVPKEISDPESVARALAETVDELHYETLLQLLSKPDDPYESLLSRTDDDTVAMIEALDLPGIYVDMVPRRFYPGDAIAAHVLGFVAPSADDSDVRGRYGIELLYEDMLRGKSGFLGEGNAVVAPEHGADIVLTIDHNIQRKAESILQRSIDKHRAQGGTVIVQDPRTGKILAMAAAPRFDPNTYFDYPISTFQNDAVEHLYEPGSIFKVVTLAAGIDSGKITAGTTYTDTGAVTLNNRTIRNWDLKARGTITMTEVLEHSVNTGAVYAQRTMGHDLFYNYLLRFGFEENTGIDLPGEVAGSLRNLRENRDINFATASFGQGVSVTPLSLIRAISAIANEGVMMRPYVIENIEKEGDVVYTGVPEETERVISEDAAREAVRMMVTAVRTNVVADISQYSVAGKTGTAQVPDLRRGGYYDDKVINTYVGFAPAFNPRFVILVKLDDPAGAPLAGQTVVPAFRELAEFILNYYGIPPDSP